MKLKILHVTQFLGIGGLEKILFILIQEQMKTGHHVDLLVYDSEQSWVKHFRESGINVISDYRKKEGYDTKLLKWFNRFPDQYDIIHTHDLNPIMYMAPLKFLRRMFALSFPKLIHTAHGMDHIKKRPVTMLYEKLCSNFTNLTIAVSPALQNFYLNRLLVPSYKVININNGTEISIPVLDKNKSREEIKKTYFIQNENPIWVYVARIVPLKNQHMLIEAARHIKTINFIFIGPSGDESYWNELQTDKPHNIFIPGASSDITHILSAADVYISASTHEGIPVTVLEAGAMKLPCLLSDIPGHRLMGPHALYFDLNNLDDLVFKINLLNQSPLLAQSLGTNLHQEVSRNFSAARMSAKYLAAYEGHV